MKHDILTPGQYKTGIEAAFADSTVSVHILDIFAFPDYGAFIGGCVDAHLSHLHTLDFTQLQWIFEHIEVSPDFPFGVKTTYRRHSSDRVCEIREMNPDQCTTDIGKVTGLEPYAVPTITQPTADTFASRNVEGFYLLTRIPCTKDTPWGPSPFDEDTETTIAKLKAGVNRFFMVGTPVRDEWNRWFADEAPKSGDVRVFLERRRLKKPLEQYFRNGSGLRPAWLRGATLDRSDYDNELTEHDWASMNSAIPGASVRCRFTSRAEEPLLFFHTENLQLERFVRTSKNFYTLINERRTAESLKVILR